MHWAGTKHFVKQFIRYVIVLNRFRKASASQSNGIIVKSLLQAQIESQSAQRKQYDIGQTLGV
jgi:hypothetical protein